MLALNEQAPIRLACASGQGYAAGDLRFTGLTSTKGTRDRITQNPTQVNVRTKVGVCSGFVAEASVPKAPKGSVNQRHARRRARKAGIREEAFPKR